MKPIIIGIAGGSGSGKSTIVANIAAALAEDVAILSHDYYYKSFEQMSYREKLSINYDDPASLDTALLLAHVRALKRGETIERPVYNFVNYRREQTSVTVVPKKVIIVEGILIFVDHALIEEMDIKLFVDTDADVRIIRRILRDVNERGRDLHSVVQQYLNTVKPMHEQFVEPSKRKADIIIPEGGHNQVALTLLIDQIKSLIEQG